MIDPITQCDLFSCYDFNNMFDFVNFMHGLGILAAATIIFCLIILREEKKLKKKMKVNYYG